MTRARSIRSPLVTKRGSEGAVLRRLRGICLSYPETTETESWGHPNFRAGKRTFVAFEMIKRRPSIAFRVAPADARRTGRGNLFFKTPYGQGRWVSLWADSALDWPLVRDLAERSYRGVALRRMLAELGRSRRRRG